MDEDINFEVLIGLIGFSAGILAVLILIVYAAVTGGVRIIR